MYKRKCIFLGWWNCMKNSITGDIIDKVLLVYHQYFLEIVHSCGDIDINIWFLNPFFEGSLVLIRSSFVCRVYSSVLLFLSVFNASVSSTIMWHHFPYVCGIWSFSLSHISSFFFKSFIRIFKIFLNLPIPQVSILALARVLICLFSEVERICMTFARMRVASVVG